MDEASLRLDYWVDTRSDPKFPLWVIFKEIGHSQTKCDHLPYARRSLRSIPELLKQLEHLAPLKAIAKDLNVPEQEVRAALWYAAWILEHVPPEKSWQEWNNRVDQAWQDGILHD
ncbi:hypothetical protein [Sulfobacillus thermosulfidooxidans]|uniref:hypothetical protein n=1 Tax=Sulfobacillus thermosulfidooxidans TaxID=28034 RepID=UPI0006B53700|nr:hypothetical protein [Sulfobacillus thermosulfidooxidans]